MRIESGSPLAAMARLYWRAYVEDRDWLLALASVGERDPKRTERETWPTWVEYDANCLARDKALLAYQDPKVTDKEEINRLHVAYLAADKLARQSGQAYYEAVREWERVTLLAENETEREETRKQMDEGRLTLCPFFWSCVYAFFVYQCLYVPYRVVRNWVSSWVKRHSAATNRILWSVFGLISVTVLTLFFILLAPETSHKVGLALGLVEPPPVVAPYEPSAEDLARWATERVERERLAEIKLAEREAQAKAEAEARVREEADRQARWLLEAPQREAQAKVDAAAYASDQTRRKAGYWGHVGRRALHIGKGIGFFGGVILAIVVGFVIVVVACAYIWSLVEGACKNGFTKLGKLVYGASFRPWLVDSIVAFLEGCIEFEDWVNGKVMGVWNPIHSLGSMVGQFLYWRFYRKACPLLTFDEALK